MSTLEAFMSDVITDIQVDDKTTQALPFKATLTASAAASFLAACGGGGGNSSSSPVVNASTVSDKITYAADYAAARFLQHAQFSSPEADITAVKNMGASAWLDAQMALPSSTGGWDWLAMRGYNVIDSNKFYEMDYQANYMAWQQIMSSPDGVRRRVALALSEFFVVSISGVSTISWSQFAMGHYWDILCKNAFGNYRQLLEEVTLSIAMGEFLNTLGNQKEDLTTGRLPDENYSREVMQLFTIGLQKLNLDGTLDKVNGAAVDTFTQSEVSNLARVFTGYQADDTEGFSDTVVAPTYKVRNVGYTRRPMVLNANRHSMLEARFLGAVVPAGTEGKAALKIALDTLFQHANVGPFFGRQMIQRLVCSNPSPAYVARVATVFNNNGKGVRGDLAAVFKAILTDVEATQDSGLTNPSFGKLREPMVRVAQWARTFKVSSIKGTWKIGNPNYSAVNALGQSPLQAPSVFNFFRPGYVPPHTSLASLQFTAPEFQLVNESTTASYINYLEDILVNGIWVRAPELITSPSDKTATDGFDIAPDYTAEMNLAGNAPALFARLNMLLCAGQLSDATLKDMINVFVVDKTNAASNDNNKRSYVAKAIMFVMCCAEYLVQK
jgi:uncharacterized protein (DUF1800 family)